MGDGLLRARRNLTNFARRFFASLIWHGQRATGVPSSSRPGTPDLSPAERHEIVIKRLMADARAAGAEAERGRILAILDHPSAKQWAKLAWALAKTNGLDAEAAQRFLEAAAIDAAAADGQPLTLH